MEPTKQPTKNLQTNDSQTAVYQQISSELDALERGELRSQAQVLILQKLLDEATGGSVDDLRRRAEQLHVRMLADEGVNPLRSLPLLAIVIDSKEDGSKDISYHEVLPTTPELTLDDLNPKNTDSPLFPGRLGTAHLATVRDARSVSPRCTVLAQSPGWINIEHIQDLERCQSRITYHHGRPLTWDKNIDGKAWSTNIDTVYFSDWLNDTGVFNSRVKSAVEIGVGTGGISQALLASCSRLERLVFTDIDPHAINAARRNLRPYRGNADVSWAIGKGLQGLVPPGSLDLIVTNPPYIPHPDGDGDKDHYSGTKMIKRLFVDGIPLLNPNNPEAAIYVQMSSVTLPDFEMYRKEHPEVEVSLVGSPVRVPLRLLGLRREPHVVDYIEKRGGLEVVPDDPLRYYHTIMAFRLRPKR